MEMTWGDQKVAEGMAAGMAQGIEALKRVVLRQLAQRFGEVPESVRRKVQAIDATEPLTELAEKVLEARSIADMGLS